MNERDYERLKECFDKNNIGLKELAEWWIYIYPEDMFTVHNYPCIALITQLMKKILEQIEKKEAVADAQ